MTYRDELIKMMYLDKGRYKTVKFPKDEIQKYIELHWTKPNISGYDNYSGWNSVELELFLLALFRKY